MNTDLAQWTTREKALLAALLFVAWFMVVSMLGAFWLNQELKKENERLKAINQAKP